MRRKAANWPSRNCLAEGGEARQATWTNSAQSHPLMYSVWRRSICATFGLWSWVIRRAWIRKSSPHKRLIGKVRRQEQEQEAGAEGRSRRQEQEAGAGGRSRRQEQVSTAASTIQLVVFWTTAKEVYRKAFFTTPEHAIQKTGTHRCYKPLISLNVTRR